MSSSDNAPRLVAASLGQQVRRGQVMQRPRFQGPPIKQLALDLHFPFTWPSLELPQADLVSQARCSRGVTAERRMPVLTISRRSGSGESALRYVTTSLALRHRKQRGYLLLRPGYTRCSSRETVAWRGVAQRGAATAATTSQVRPPRMYVGRAFART